MSMKHFWCIRTIQPPLAQTMLILKYDRVIRRLGLHTPLSFHVLTCNRLASGHCNDERERDTEGKTVYPRCSISFCQHCA